MMTPWAPAPADPLRLTILAGLAGQFEDAYVQVAAGSAAWCDLAVKLISEMN